MVTGASELSWLRRLVDDSLLQFTEPEIVVSINKEKEREILIALSEVLKEIKLRIQHINANSQTDTEINPSCDDEESGSKTQAEDDQYLLEIVASMMFFLTVKSQFVQHVAENALVSVSEFVYTIGNCWADFIHLLCICLELAIIGTRSHSSASSIGSDCSDHGLSKVKISLTMKLKNCDWDTVAAISQVLRCIFKYLMDDHDNDFIKVYFDSFCSSLSNIPWELVEEHGVCVERQIKFLGAFIQLLCSVVKKNDFLEAGDGSSCGHPLHIKIISLIPRLMKWSIDKRGNFNDICIVQYLRHKLLVLMVKLSYCTTLDHLVLLSWLQFISNYFEEYLQWPIRLSQSCQDDCLDSSPFLLNLYDGDMPSLHFQYSSHIQRLTVLLFLKCCFSLIFPKQNNEKCTLRLTMPDIISDKNTNLNCSCREKGLRDLCRWLRMHLPPDTFLKQNVYFERCIKLSTSFIQLYLQEDDLLFEVLLQSLSIPPSAENKTFKGEVAFEDLHKDVVPCVSDVFNPVYLFHLFLSGILYDHQVLLDYLISKDTGIRCAEYLLRCLRLVCDCWNEFLEFSAHGSLKKRKVLRNDLKHREVEVPSTMDGDEGPGKDSKLEYKYSSMKKLPFQEAKECLLSLKASVETLNRKNLFPYDPTVLLRRLGRFQEYCYAEEDKESSCETNQITLE